MSDRDDGFSLVGPLIASAVVALMIMGMVRGLPVVTEGVCQTRWQTLATVAAQNKLEQLKWSGATSLGEHAFSLAAAVRKKLPEAAGYYEVSDGGNGLREVVVTVTWQTKRGEQEVVLATLMD